MAMTADTYGDLLPDLEGDAAKMEAGALALVQEAHGSTKAPQRSRPYALAGQGEGALSLGQSLGSGARWILVLRKRGGSQGLRGGLPRAIRWARTAKAEAVRMRNRIDGLVALGIVLFRLAGCSSKAP